MSGRFIVGIDLGTTNSAVAQVDTEAARQAVETVAVPQLVAPGERERLDTRGRRGEGDVRWCVGGHRSDAKHGACQRRYL